MKLPKVVPERRKVLAFVKSPLMISMIKGTIAYTLVHVLIFLGAFERLFTYPVVTTSLTIVAIAGFPGKSVGNCVASTMLAMLGVSFGAFFFWVLANIHSAIGQACVFFVIVYVLAMIKAIGVQYFGFALLAVLMSFYGIYTSVLVGGFSKDYLIDYFRAYLWGGAIVLFVNIFIFPHTAEKELRMTLVTSLNHIRTFAHLIGKTYRQDINDEERKTRDALNQSIRSDFTLLNMKLAETGLEVNWSRWSLADYQYMVGQTRMMQQALITTYSSLMGVESSDIELFKTFLPGARKDFDKLHKAIYISLSDVQRELNVGPWRPGAEAEYYKDLERQDSRTEATRGDMTAVSADEESDDTDVRLRAVQDRLAAELDSSSIDDTPRHSFVKDRSDDDASPAAADSAPTKFASEDGGEKVRPPSTDEKRRDGLPAAMDLAQTDYSPCVLALRKRWEAFRDVQFDRMGEIMAGGTLHGNVDELLVNKPMPSVRHMWGHDFVRGQASDKPEQGLLGHPDDLLNAHLREASRHRTSAVPLSPRRASQPEQRRTRTGTLINDEGDFFEPMGESAGKEEAISTHHSLVRVYSFLFAMNAFVDSVITLHRYTRGHSAESPERKPRKRRLHFHIFERMKIRKLTRKQKKREKVMSEAGEGDETESMTLKEALAALEGKPYVPDKITWGERIANWELFLRSANSICAFKTACATTIFAIFFWVETTRAWATAYGVQSGLITVVVALSPTLGQSLFTFLLQIGGQGLGYIYGCILCEIFHNVGGYKYNPYGFTALLAAGSLPAMYIIYSNPIMFAFGLLFLNSASIITVTEYTYRANPNFDGPGLRLGKGLAVLAIALTLVFIFQLVILRNPARRMLRKAIANIVLEVTAYALLLQAYVRATVPADGEVRASSASIQRTFQDLKRRETSIQGQLIGVMPLIKFSGVEPSLVRKFDTRPWIRIIRANQIILDRFRDARIAIGTTPIDKLIIETFAMPLSPYRRRSTRYIRAGLYACSSALRAKLALPHELPSTSDFLPSVFNDCLVLSSRTARTPEGLNLVKSPEFTRYWLYLLSATSAGMQIDEICDACKTLFGEMEDDVPLRFGTKED